MTSKEALSDLVAMATLTLNKDVAKRLAIIAKDLEALEIIKKYSFVFVEDGQLKSGRYADVEILLDESDFETKEEYELLKEVLVDE